MEDCLGGFIDAVLKVKSLYHLARCVTIRYRRSSIYKDTFMRYFFHDTVENQAECIISCTSSLRFAPLLQEMVQHVSLNEDEWRTVATNLCRKQTSTDPVNNLCAMRLLSNAIKAQLVNPDEIFHFLVPNFSSFDNAPLCRLVVGNMRSFPSITDMCWAIDNLDDELAAVISNPMISNPMIENADDVQQEVEEAERISVSKTQSTSLLFKMVTPFIEGILKNLFETSNLNPRLIILMREYFPEIFIFESTLVDTVVIGMFNLRDNLFFVRTWSETIEHFDSPRRVSELIGKLCDFGHFVNAKWLLQHVIFDRDFLVTDSPWRLELIGYDMVKSTIDTTSVVFGSELWKMVHSDFVAAANVKHLPDLILRGEKLRICEYAKLSVWPVRLSDGRVFALWDALQTTDLRLCPSLICTHTWEIICDYTRPSVLGDISLLLC